MNTSSVSAEMRDASALLQPRRVDEKFLRVRREGVERHSAARGESDDRRDWPRVAEQLAHATRAVG